MLWAALTFPALPLEVFLRGKPSTESDPAAASVPRVPRVPCVPWIAIDANTVLAGNTAARERGIQPGMGVSAAYALAPNLVPHQRDPARERDALVAVAMWASQFTPSISFEPSAFEPPASDAIPTRKADRLPQHAGLLLELEPSLKLFGGLAPILTGLRSGVEALGFTTVIACAPTARGAWWLARAGREARIEDIAQLRSALSALPLDAIECSAAARLTFESIGVRNIGAALALPRDGFARRFGQTLLDSLERALGRLAEPRRFFVPPDRFHAKLELPAAVEHAEALLFATRRLVVQLCGYLAGRASGISQLTLGLHHDEGAPTTLTIGLVSPGRDEAHFVLLLRERLAATRLRAPVYTIEFGAEDIVPLAGRPLTLFDDPLTQSDGWAKLVERLRARLGHDAVQGLALAAEHRPEWVVQQGEPGAKPQPLQFGPRPLWLLRAPQRLLEVGELPHHKGPLTLLAGPERIESGWWDGHDIARDYFIAEDSDRALLWVYRERHEAAGWFLHGLFS